MIAVQIKLSLFNQFQTDLTSIVFDCNSATTPDFKRYANIRFAIASLIQANSYHSDGTDYMNYSLSYYLVSQLLENFKSNASETLQKQQKYMERLTRIINFIKSIMRKIFPSVTLPPWKICLYLTFLSFLTNIWE